MHGPEIVLRKTPDQDVQKPVRSDLPKKRCDPPAVSPDNVRGRRDAALPGKVQESRQRGRTRQADTDRDVNTRRANTRDPCKHGIDIERELRGNFNLESPCLYPRSDSASTLRPRASHSTSSPIRRCPILNPEVRPQEFRGTTRGSLRRWLVEQPAGCMHPLLPRRTRALTP